MQPRHPFLCGCLDYGVRRPCLSCEVMAGFLWVRRLWLVFCASGLSREGEIQIQEMHNFDLLFDTSSFRRTRHSHVSKLFLHVNHLIITKPSQLFHEDLHNLLYQTRLQPNHQVDLNLSPVPDNQRLRHPAIHPSNHPSSLLSFSLSPTRIQPTPADATLVGILKGKGKWKTTRHDNSYSSYRVSLMVSLHYEVSWLARSDEMAIRRE